MTKKILILVTLILGLIVRLYKIDSPIADWHSWRQADTASVTKNFINHTGTFFIPTYHDLSNIPSGQENPHGYRMVELPIYNLIAAGLSKFCSVEIASRLVSIFFSLGSALLVYFITISWTKNFKIGFFAFSIFLFLPFNIYYSRTILPEPTAVFFMLLSLYLFTTNFYLSAIALAISVLIKPYTALLLFPIFLFLSWHKKITAKFAFCLIAFLPLFFWRLWIKNFPAGIPASAWLFNGGKMRFRPVWFRWLFYERIGKLIMGVLGVIPLYLGLAFRKNKNRSLCFFLFLGILTYFTVIARGNIQHDYYQILIIPFIAIITGIGLNYMFKFSSFLGTIIVIIFALAFSWYQIRDYYIIDSAIVEAGQAAQQFLPKDAWVIAPRNGDTAFLYQTNHAGWPIEIYDLETLKSRYPEKKFYLVTVNKNSYTTELKEKYSVIIDNNNYTIVDLNK